MEQERTYYTSQFYYKAKEYVESEKPILNSEIGKDDLTEIFIKELENMLINREAINININAPVRSGKSSVAIMLGVLINQLMIKLKLTNNRFGIWNIARSQYELSKKIRDPRLNNTVIVIDEYDDIEATGANSTVEQALLASFSKIQAGRYIHRIYCSPSDSPDTESDIWIEVVATNKKNKTTHCKLSYRYPSGGYKTTQLIGHIDLDVAPVLANWVDNGIEKLFYQKDKTERDNQIITTQRKIDFYTEYMCRKFEKMDMINEKGIFRLKDLDFSDIKLEIIKRNRPLTKLIKFDIGLCKGEVIAEARKRKIALSIITEHNIADHVKSVLQICRAYYESIKELKTMKKKMDSGKITEDDFQDNYKEYRQLVIQLNDNIENQIKELEILSHIKKKFYGEGLNGED